MSRHELCGREPYISIVVGWDSPLRTYFAQVLDGRVDVEEEALVRWIGCFAREIPTVGILTEALEPFVTLTAELWEQLARDRVEDLAAAKETTGRVTRERRPAPSNATTGMETMITLKSFERTPSLAELKVSYKRGRPKDDRQGKMPWVLSSPITCEKYLRTLWDKDTIDLREEFVVVCLNFALEVLGWVKLHTGGMDISPVDPRLVFAVALQTASAAIVVAHNHPTGNLKPSDADRVVTRRLRDGSAVLGIRFLDHVILNRDGYYSFAEAGEC